MGATFTAIVVTGILATATAFALNPSGAAPRTAPNWSSPVTLQAPSGMPASIACPSPSLCFVVDASGDVASLASPPVQIDTHSLSSISCPTSSFCAAVDRGGDYVKWTGRNWSSPSFVDTYGLTALACTAATFCVATDVRGDAVTYNGTSWSKPRRISGLIAPDAVSCAKSSMCVAVNAAGDAAIYSYGSWSKESIVDVHGLEDVSCPTTALCVAVDDDGGVATRSGTHWTVLKGVDGKEPFASISCTDPSGPVVCVAIDAVGSELKLQSGHWTRHKSTDTTGEPTAITCTSSTTCAFVDAAGYEYSNSTGPWTRTLIDAEGGSLSQTACTASSCTVVGTGSADDTFSGTAWLPLEHSPISDLTAVSCVGGFCAMGGSSGHVVTWSGTWSHVSTFGSTDVTGISCVASNFCMAVNLLGQYSTWNGVTWTAATDAGYPYGRGIGAVACPTANACVMTDHTGREIVWHRGGRSSFKVVDTVGSDLTSIACPTAIECIAVDSSGHTVTTTFTPTSFDLISTRIKRIDANGLSSISCGTAEYCGAVDASGNFLSWDKGVWSTPSHVDNVLDLISLSCSSKLCAALDQNNHVVEGPVP
jgi:hypothetical protein